MIYSRDVSIQDTLFVGQFILGGIAKRTYAVAVQLLDNMAKMNREV